MAQRDLERHQVWIYLAAILAGLGLGLAAPGTGGQGAAAVWPLLGLLLFVTFTQLRPGDLPRALRDGCFMGGVVVGNFVIVPLIVAALLPLLPDDPAVRLGVLLVLLMPCTDWYVSFTHLAGGDTARAVAVTPLTLILQMALLPAYLWLFMGHSLAGVVAVGPVLGVFLTVIALPLVLAWALERRARAHAGRTRALARLGWLPVPLLALVLFLIAASQVPAVTVALPLLPQVAGVFLGYLALALLAGLALARGFRLAPRAGRALVFSLGTRNSFVALPLALALPPEWRLAVVVIVLQSLVELFGALVWLRVVPRLLPAGPGGPGSAP